MFKKNTNLISETIDNLVCIFDLEKQVSYDLDQIGSEIWNLSDNNSSIEDIVNILFDKYDVDIETLREDVENFLNNSVELGMYTKI